MAHLITISSLILFGCIFYIQAQEPCREYKTCLLCFEDPECGWCSGMDNLCVVGNSTGPAEGTCEWNYYTCPGTTTSTSTSSTTSTTSTTTSPPTSASWDTVGPTLTVSNMGKTVTRTAASSSWDTAWINTTLCSKGLLNVTVNVNHYFNDPENIYNAVFGLVSQTCANSYTGTGINELIGWTSSGGCGGWSYISEDGYKMTNSEVTSYGTTWTKDGDLVRMEADLTSGSITFFVNGKSQGVAFTRVTSDNYYAGVSIIAQTTSFTIVSATCQASSVTGRVNRLSKY